MLDLALETVLDEYNDLEYILQFLKVFDNP